FVSVMDPDPAALLSRLNPQDGQPTLRAACKKCGYPGHLTFQCMNFIKVNPNKDVVLDVESTSSDTEDETPLVSLRKEELLKQRKHKKKKKKEKEKKKKKQKKSYHSDDSDTEKNAKKRKRYYSSSDDEKSNRKKKKR
ncbi:unnamed protein product, partial [Cyprideis torosa]